jgi:hypothetical protein
LNPSISWLASVSNGTTAITLTTIFLNAYLRDVYMYLAAFFTSSAFRHVRFNDPTKG